MIKLKFRNQRDRKPIVSLDEINNSGLLIGDYADADEFGLEDGDILHLKLVNSAGIVADVDFEVSENDDNAKAEGFNFYLFEMPNNPKEVEIGVCSILVNDQEPEQIIEEDEWSDDEEDEEESDESDDDEWSDDEDDFEDEPVAKAKPALKAVKSATSTPVVAAAKQAPSGRFEYLSYQQLQYLINKNGGNKTAAAKEAGCSIDTFRRMLKKAEEARPAKKKAQAAKTKAKSSAKKKAAPKKKAASKSKTKSRR